MPVVHKWQFLDPYDPNPGTNSYTFNISPNEMSSPFQVRPVTPMTTTGINGQMLFFEGGPAAKEWNFGGTLLTQEQYLMLQSWVYDRRRRIYVVDHFGRQILAVLNSFDAVPARSLQHYWRHTWTINAHVVSVSAPTVGEIWA